MTLRSIVLNLRDHWPRWLFGAAVAVHLLMMGSLFWGYLDPLFASSARQATDFFSIYEAGHRALENRSIYIEDPSSPTVTPYHIGFRYVPAFAYVFAVPANLLPAWPAYWTWVAMNELLLVANAYATWRVAGRGPWAYVAAGMWFVFTPFYLEQNMGQFSFLMTTAAFWVGVGIARSREALGGALWALSLNIKSNTGLLLPLFVRRGWWRSIVGGVALILLNTPYFLFHPNDFKLFYTANFRTLVDSGGRFFAYNPELEGLPALVRNSFLALDNTATGLPASVSLVLMLSITGVALAATVLPRENDLLAAFAIWLCTYFLIYEPWEHHYVLFLPAATLLVGLRPDTRPWVLVAFVLVALPTPYWLANNVWNTAAVPPHDSLVSPQEAWSFWGVALHHAAKPLPVLGLWAYLIARQFRDGVDASWLVDVWSRARALGRPAGTVEA